MDAILVDVERREERLVDEAAGRVIRSGVEVIGVADGELAVEIPIELLRNLDLA